MGDEYSDHVLKVRPFSDDYIAGRDIESQNRSGIILREG